MLRIFVELPTYSETNCFEVLKNNTYFPNSALKLLICVFICERLIIKSTGQRNLNCSAPFWCLCFTCYLSEKVVWGKKKVLYQFFFFYKNVQVQHVRVRSHLQVHRSVVLVSHNVSQDAIREHLRGGGVIIHGKTWVNPRATWVKPGLTMGQPG
jgi:hypothetical protein